MLNGRPSSISRGQLAAGICVFLAFLVWSLAFVPPEMDEFAAFHRLACLSPYGHLNTFRESCDAYKLDVGGFSYYRSYGYIGATSSALYFPVWTVWRSPWSFYVLGVLAFIGFSYALTKALGIATTYAIIPLCYFPLAYSMIHDTAR
jgi:hypothetical protein